MDEPVTPGAPEAGSEPPVEVILEEANDVIIQIISFVATAAVLLVAWSLRVQKRAKQQRQKPKKRETLPKNPPSAHVTSREVGGGKGHQPNRKKEEEVRKSDAKVSA